MTRFRALALATPLFKCLVGSDTEGPNHSEEAFSAVLHTCFIRLLEITVEIVIQGLRDSFLALTG